MAIDDADDLFRFFRRHRDRHRPTKEPLDDDGIEAADVVRVDPERDMPGSVYAVPNSYWRIPGGTSHPGACAYCSVAAQHATFVKGTDVKSARPDITPILLIQPSPVNGLSKPTAFALAPWVLRLNKAVLLHFDRRMGALDPEDLARLRRELSRLFDQGRGGSDA